MGLYPQPNRWQCGPFALKHALVTLGIFAREREITALARADRKQGADEHQLARAARHFGCDLPTIRRHQPELARRDLLQHLGRGHPVLLCIREWAHWVTVVKAESGKFIVLDSEDARVLTIYSWGQLQRVWPYHERDDGVGGDPATLFDLCPVIPRARVRTHARFSLARARFLRRPAHRHLAAHWDDYLADLLVICRPRTALSARVLSMGEFFRRHDRMILDQLDYWHGSIPRSAGARVLRDLHFVADTYGLVIHTADEKRAIAAISILLALWAAARVRVDRFY